MQIGTTFDPDYAQSLGLNWQKTLENIVKSSISLIRIGIKWNKVEAEQGKYFWDDYDTIFKIISSANISTILEVGMKSPRWPEFYVPDWIKPYQLRNNTIDNSQTELKEHLFKFITKTIQRYGHLATLQYLQVENEPLMRFGEPNWKISYDFLKDEVAFARKYQYFRLILTDSGLPTSGLLPEYLRNGHKDKERLLKLADVIGFNIFPRFEGKVLGAIPHTFKASRLEWSYMKKWKERIEKAGKECLITELQAEPWEIGQIDYKDAFGNKTCNPILVKKYLDKLESIGFEKVLIWGSEFHWKCKSTGNNTWLDTIYDLV